MPLFDEPPQVSLDPDLIRNPIWVAGMDKCTAVWIKPVHQHRKGQFCFTARGLVTCETKHQIWVVPAQYGLWVPSGIPHRSETSLNAETYCVFLDPDRAAPLPKVVSMFPVNPLLQELLRRAARLSEITDADGPGARIAAVILDELARAPVENLRLPVPSDHRLRRIADGLIANPADKATAAEWAARVGLSERTLSRLLREEIGMSLGRWKRQLHAIVGLRRLSDGETVQVVAATLGYESASSFTTMFRKTLGKPPMRYLKERRTTFSSMEA